MTEYYLYDGLGSAVMLTDALGNPTQMYQYDAFGGTQNLKRDPFNRYRFVGLAQDDSLGLSYMNARWYDAGVGRFIGRDPVDGSRLYPQSLNRYSYVSNNPVNMTDTSGYEWWNPFSWFRNDEKKDDSKDQYANGEDTSQDNPPTGNTGIGRLPESKLSPRVKPLSEPVKTPERENECQRARKKAEEEARKGPIRTIDRREAEEAAKEAGEKAYQRCEGDDRKRKDRWNSTNYDQRIKPGNDNPRFSDYISESHGKIRRHD